jgi:hypothetical protein
VVTQYLCQNKYRTRVHAAPPAKRKRVPGPGAYAADGPESFYEDSKLASDCLMELLGDPRRSELFIALTAAAESGWDFVALAARSAKPVLTHQQRRSKVERRRACTVVAATAPSTRRLQLTRRRLPVLLDRPPITSSSFFSYSSTLRGCRTKFSLVSAGGLLSSTAHLLILIVALKSRFTNSIRFLPSLVVLTSASGPHTFALLSICSSVSGPYFFTSSGLLWHFSISTL